MYYINITVCIIAMCIIKCDCLQQERTRLRGKGTQEQKAAMQELQTLVCPLQLALHWHCILWLCNK